ncbi:NAD(P)/FAD-dependent oxidoreductase [Glutamicibacter mysorens]
MTRIVIVGASVGGVKTAQALRNEGFDGELVLVEQENIAHPYDKPPLSKFHLTSGQDISAIPLVDAGSMDSVNATWKFGVAASDVDATNHNLVLEDGSSISYDKLVIATGARARRSPWGEGPGIHVLRSAQDAEELRTDLLPGRHLVIIGGGFIGAEVAATARKAGLSVSIVDPLPAPMSRVLNTEVGDIFRSKHEAEGIEAYFGVGVDGIDRVPDEGVSKLVRLSDGTVLEADTVLVGIGAQVNTEWLNNSALMLDNGVVCNEYLQATEVEDIFVVGDVCRWQTGESTTRLEHWTNATDQALLVAHNMLNVGDERSYTPNEYVWSDQFDWKIQVVGHTGAAEFHIVGNTTVGRFAVIYTGGSGEACGAVIVNWPRALVKTRQAVMRNAPSKTLREELIALDSKLAKHV